MNRKAYSTDLSDALRVPAGREAQPSACVIDSQSVKTTDRDGAQLLLERLAGAFPRLRHIRADMGYRGRAVEWIKAQLGWTVEIVQRPSKWGRYPIDVEPPPVPRWTTLPRRWVVERTFARLGRCRRMSQDCECRTETSEAFIYAATVRLMLRRLARTSVETG